MANDAALAAAVSNGDRCEVIGGSHAGKSGVVEDRKVSKTGAVTITVRQARNVVARRG
jgi:ribosomal protein L24